jgi:hypothetical protein
MHGGTNKGAPKGNKHAWQHGNRSREAEGQLKMLAASNRDIRLVKKLNAGLQLSAKEQERLLSLHLQQRSQA